MPRNKLRLPYPSFFQTTKLVVTGSTIFKDNVEATFGDDSDAGIAWNTVQTVDGLYVGLKDGQNTLIIAERGDRGFDFAHGAQTTPTIFVQSQAQSTTQFGSWTHNGTNVIFATGLGNINLQPISGTLLLNPAVASPSFAIQGNTANGVITLNLANNSGTEYSQRADLAAAEFRFGVRAALARVFIFTDLANIAVDHGVAVQTHPTIHMHSVNSPAGAPNEYRRFLYDGSEAVDYVGAGGFRRYLNSLTKHQGIRETNHEVATTDDTLTTIATIAIPTNTVVAVETIVNAIQDNGNAGAVFIQSAYYRNDAGTVSQIGGADAHGGGQDAALATTSLTWSVSGTNALLRVTGVAATNLQWGANVIKHITAL